MAGRHPIAAAVWVLGMGAAVFLGARTGYEASQAWERDSYRRRLDAAIDLAERDMKSGRAALEALAQERPEEPQVNYNLGVSLRQLREPEKAVMHLEKVVAQNPSDHEARAEYAAAIAQAGDWDKGLAELAKVPVKAPGIIVRLQRDRIWMRLFEHPKMSEIRKKHGLPTADGKTSLKLPDQ